MYVHTLQGQRSCCWYPEGGEEEAVLGGEYYFRCIQMAAVEIHSYVRTYVHTYLRTYVRKYVWCISANTIAYQLNTRPCKATCTYSTTQQCIYVCSFFELPLLSHLYWFPPHSGYKGHHPRGWAIVCAGLLHSRVQTEKWIWKETFWKIPAGMYICMYVSAYLCRQQHVQVPHEARSCKLPTCHSTYST